MTPRHYRLGILTLVSLVALSSALAGPLHDAAFIGDINEVKRLIAEGIDVNQKDFGGRTPLHLTARYGYPAVAEHLIANGADVDAKDNGGRTPLIEAAAHGDAAVVELLIAKGADVNAKDQDGLTPLQRAVRMGYKNMVQLLKRHGAKGRVTKRSTKKKRAKKKRTEWQEISENETTLVLYAPGLADAQVTFKRRGSVSRGTDETGHWQARGSGWPQAWLLVRGAAQRYFFVDGGPPLREIIRNRFPGTSVVFGHRGKAVNHFGNLEFQRLTLTIAGANIPCVAMLQYAGYVWDGVVGHREAIGDTLIFGWYCAEPGAELSDETVESFFAGIGVRGIRVPEKPLALARPGQDGSKAYRIAIFPFAGYFQQSTDAETADSLEALIQREPALALAYSDDDSALNEPRIKNPKRLWVGSAIRKKPNLELLYTIGRERDLNGIVMVWGGGLNWGYRGTERMPIMLYLMDVDRRQVYQRKGTVGTVKKMTGQVFADFINGRGGVTPVEKSGYTTPDEYEFTRKVVCDIPGQGQQVLTYSTCFWQNGTPIRDAD